MEFRKSTTDDIEDILNIIRQAQEYLKDAGIDQWQNGYPNKETIEKDIKEEHSYVLVENNKVIATAAISFDEEKTYSTIFEGSWLSDKTYAVIHRIAVERSLKGSGLASIIIKETERLSLQKGVASIKVDTHKNNLSMQRFLEKNGFSYCGIIYLEDGSKRLAYEKFI